MTAGIFLAVLFSAVMHAAWNAMIRAGEDRYQGMLLLTITQGVFALVLIAVRPFPTGEAWLWLIGSGIFHAGYKLFLAAAYERGDLSRVYPIARGAAPVFILITGFFVLADELSAREMAGIVVIGAGIMLMARGVWRGGEARALVPLALGSAACTAGYSIVDGSGARVLGDATAYTGWLFLFDLILFSFVTATLRGRKVFHASVQTWAKGAVAGLLSMTTYWIVIWAMTKAPIALVSAVRETSVLFAVLIGWLFMGERMGSGKWIAALVILAGMIATRI